MYNCIKKTQIHQCVILVVAVSAGYSELDDYCAKILDTSFVASSQQGVKQIEYLPLLLLNKSNDWY